MLYADACIISREGKARYPSDTPSSLLLLLLLIKSRGVLKGQVSRYWLGEGKGMRWASVRFYYVAKNIAFMLS